MKIDLNDPAVWAELERQAYDGTVNLPPLPPAAYKYFSELTAIYHAFRFDGLPKSEAENRKRMIRKAYDLQVLEIRQARDVYAQYQANIKTAELRMSEIEKSQDVHEIARLSCEIVGLLTGDESFYPRQIWKLESKSNG